MWTKQIQMEFSKAHVNPQAPGTSKSNRRGVTTSIHDVIGCCLSRSDDGSIHLQSQAPLHESANTCSLQKYDLYLWRLQLVEQPLSSVVSYKLLFYFFAEEFGKPAKPFLGTGIMVQSEIRNGSLSPTWFGSHHGHKRDRHNRCRQQPGGMAS